ATQAKAASGHGRTRRTRTEARQKRHGKPPWTHPVGRAPRGPRQPRAISRFPGELDPATGARFELSYPGAMKVLLRIAAVLLGLFVLVVLGVLVFLDPIVGAAIEKGA